jgi:phosphatidylglycerophosphatase C
MVLPQCGIHVDEKLPGAAVMRSGFRTGVARFQEVMVTGRPVVAAFDFDKTITHRDTFVPYLELAFGKRRVREAFIRLAPLAARVACGLATRDIFKERLIRILFEKKPVSPLVEVGHLHGAAILGLVRTAARKRIDWHKEQGHRLIMVSASLDLYLAPVAQALGFDDLLCTMPSQQDAAFDGGLMGRNCWGPEKLSRLCNLLGDLAQYEMHAYGDSAGDYQMLDAADVPYYRSFSR